MMESFAGMSKSVVVSGSLLSSCILMTASWTNFWIGVLEDLVINDRETWIRLNPFSICYLTLIELCSLHFPTMPKVLASTWNGGTPCSCEYPYDFWKFSLYKEKLFFPPVNFPGNKLRVLQSWGTRKKHPEQLNSQIVKSTTQLCLWSTSLWELFKHTFRVVCLMGKVTDQRQHFFPVKMAFSSGLTILFLKTIFVKIKHLSTYWRGKVRTKNCNKAEKMHWTEPRFRWRWAPGEGSALLPAFSANFSNEVIF